jgi:hypothetical protein
MFIIIIIIIIIIIMMMMMMMMMINKEIHMMISEMIWIQLKSGND